MAGNYVGNDGNRLCNKRSMNKTCYVYLFSLWYILNSIRYLHLYVK